MSRLPSKVFCSVSHACVDLNLGHNGSPQDLIHHFVVLCILRNKYLEVANGAKKKVQSKRGRSTLGWEVSRFRRCNIKSVQAGTEQAKTFSERAHQIGLCGGQLIMILGES
jgi:hypothetical protein